MRPIERVLAVCCIGVFAVVSFSASHAAEITVSPGAGTLATAVQSAASGDTLILEEGSYAGDVLLDKSLIIRPVTRSTQAILSGVITIDGPGIGVTLQGLEFRQNLQVRQAGNTRILENYWPVNGIDALGYISSLGIGSLVIIGNRLVSGSIIFDGMNAYVAGNLVASGVISQRSGTAWIVGNEINGRNGSLVAAGEEARVIGNRVTCSWSSFGRCVDLTQSGGVILNNVVRVSWGGGGLTSTTAFGVQAVVGVVVRNNLIYCQTGSTQRIYNLSNTSGTQGNILVSDGTCRLTDVVRDFTHNICFGAVVTSCPEGDGNLAADPQFIDLVDFRLGPGSPAIDAGPPDVEYADLDRTRNDMGPRGGSWNIDQFDPQRDPNNLAPYVYPIVTRNSPAAGDEFELRAIGAAKLR